MILRVRGLRALVTDLQAAGVRFLDGRVVTRDGLGELAYFFDAAGILVGLQERSPQSQRPEDREAERRWAKTTSTR